VAQGFAKAGFAIWLFGYLAQNGSAAGYGTSKNRPWSSRVPVLVKIALIRHTGGAGIA
jgi:hypothetical protein